MAVLPAMSDFLCIWDTSTRAAEKVALGAHVHQQELTVACWATDDVQLAIGASKGALVIFDTGLNRIKHNLQGVHERVRTRSQPRVHVPVDSTHARCTAEDVSVATV